MAFLIANSLDDLLRAGQIIKVLSLDLGEHDLPRKIIRKTLELLLNFLQRLLIFSLLTPGERD